MPEATPSFGRYTDPVILGAGGMGAVYRAHDPSLDRYVAIKVLTQREPRSVERLRREAQVLAKIAHPSIVQIYEIVGSSDGQADPYIVMEYFPGTPLDQLVKAGPLAAAQVSAIVRQAAQGLRKAHASHVIHRDIKPGNLMLAESGEVKILDFGIARLRDTGESGATVLGTPHYMSPEQALGQPLDPRTDIYSLGITAFHLLSGRRPFEAKGRSEAMLAHVRTPLPNLRDFVQCPDALAKIIEKMCSKRREERFQSCDELIAALDALPQSLGGRGEDTLELELAVPLPPPRIPPAPARRETPTGQPPARPRPAPRPATALRDLAAPPGRRRQLLIAGGGGSALLLVLAVLVLRGSAGPSGSFRVPTKGWVKAAAPAPPLKKLQKNGGYGNCLFSTRQIDRDQADPDALGDTFSAADPIQGRCYFPGPLGRNKAGEVWQELWIDGIKRSQVVYDPALPEDQDQLSLDLSRRHAARLAELSPGRHTVDIWIYRQPAGVENPQPLAAGELVVRKEDRL